MTCNVLIWLIPHVTRQFDCVSAWQGTTIFGKRRPALQVKFIFLQNNIHYGHSQSPQLFEKDTDRHFFGTNNFIILLHVQVIFQYDLFYTALSLGESCIHSRQCMMKMPYSTCGTDRKCRCQLAFLELNNSCSPGIYYCVSNLFILLPSIIS